MKDLSLVFLEKFQLQLRANSKLIALFGIPSIWESLKDMFD